MPENVFALNSGMRVRAKKLAGRSALFDFFCQFGARMNERSLMDIKALDAALQAIESKRDQLGKLDYNNPQYDDLEEQLHDLEDDFQDNYGEYLEDALQKVHEEICPDSEVLLPIAYVGKGVFVEVDKYPGKDTKLILASNPTRILFKVGKEKQEVVWTAK